MVKRFKGIICSESGNSIYQNCYRSVPSLRLPKPRQKIFALINESVKDLKNEFLTGEARQENRGQQVHSRLLAVAHC
jgi:hypothetical protein